MNEFFIADALLNLPRAHEFVCASLTHCAVQCTSSAVAITFCVVALMMPKMNKVLQIVQTLLRETVYLNLLQDVMLDWRRQTNIRLDTASVANTSS